MRPAEAIWSAAGSSGHPAVSLVGQASLPSAFDVTGLATDAIGAASAALAEFVSATTPCRPAVSVDRRLASLWLSSSIQPIGWTLPPAWDVVAGDYRTADGWIRLHTNAPHHRDAALAVLGAPADRSAVTDAVARWQADALESAIVAAGGCAATMRSAAAWADHPQGRAVAAEPVIHRSTHDAALGPPRRVDPARPLAGLRVLDLTRVLAGPTATRFLAGFGADVLRIDPPFWVEPNLEPEMTLGKRCAELDLRRPADADRLRA
ncbi:MAG: CoA transferase, partial [Pseudomonadota bacterium]|nr:CoA transferase [Pseudomonadota bacterium]